MPFKKINEWLEKEKKLGSPNPDRMVLATTSPTGIPHSRIVAIREINESGVLFFTQRATRKVTDLTANPLASMTLWLPLQQREVILDGLVSKLSPEENCFYWDTLPHDRQIKFSLHRSGEPINSLADLNSEYQNLLKTNQHLKIPNDDHYCGYRLCPDTLYFYTLGIDEFSEVIKYSRTGLQWEHQLISP